MKFTTVNPATEEVIKEYTVMSEDEVFSIIKKSHEAFLSWRDQPISLRAAMMNKLAISLRNKKEEYAKIMSQEMGKPITDARAEVEKCAWTAEIYAQNGEKWFEEEIVEADGKEHKVIFQPLGVVLSIMPWNFPFWQAIRFAIPGILAGNGSILKHASNVTGSAFAIEDAFRSAGFPEGLFSAVIADHKTIEKVIASDYIQGVSLTGSTTVGKHIGEMAGRNLKKVVLELGGSDPFIVLKDANIDFTAKNAALGRMINNGQSCIAAKRFIVEEPIAEEFGKKFAEYVASKKMGDPSDDTTEVGPLVHEKQMNEISLQVDDALSKGAKILTGGKKPDQKGFYYEATVLTNVTPDMKVCKEETFGPVAPIIVVKDEDEAIKVANDSEFGLGASIWTKDEKKGLALAEKLECGDVFINSIVKSDPRLPFGGVKNSGLGRELSKYGLKEFVNVKAISLYEHG